VCYDLSGRHMKQVTAGIIQKGGAILIARRRDDDALAGKWELPGGKIEPNETAEDCLRRELDEELGLEVVIDRYFCNSIFTYPKGQIELLAFLCSCDGEPTKMLAHAEVRWEKIATLQDFDFAPADIPIVARLVSERSAK
jgi:8-oxo-dGTP diphosphatase